MPVSPRSAVAHRAANPAYPAPALVRAVCRELSRACGENRLGNPTDPTDDFVYITVSNKTAPLVARRTYELLKERYATWDEFTDAPLRDVQKLLRPAGLATVRARLLRAAMRRIRREFGCASLLALRRRSYDDQLNYLRSLPGVSDKVARCIMMYTLGAPVLPVDTHVHRVTKRLGWIEQRRPDQCHDALEKIVPEKFRFSFHVGAIVHGRAICRPVEPKCDSCSLRPYCSEASRR